MSCRGAFRRGRLHRLTPTCHERAPLPVNRRAMLPIAPRPLRPLRWEDDGLVYVDQRRLPGELVWARAMSVPDVLAALGAKAVAGTRHRDLFTAFGAVLARRTCAPGGAFDDAVAALRAASPPSESASIERVLAAGSGNELAAALDVVADNIALDRAIAEHGSALLPADGAVLTIGSSGALSTGGWGTAAGAILTAHAAGKRVHAYVSETRPLTTGLRLTAFECQHAGVRCTVVPDGAAAVLMRTQRIAAVLVAATGAAANGDVRGELGTYALAIAAAHHRVPFYALLPRAAIDRSAQTGDALPLASLAPGQRWPPSADDPPGREIFAALEDRTPGNLIAGIITEYGVARPPYDDALASLATRPAFALVRRAPA